MFRGFWVVPEPKAGVCELSIDLVSSASFLIFGADFWHFFLPTIGGVWTESRLRGAHTAWEARP